jgi:diacylglycerol kinase family enzyme
MGMGKGKLAIIANPQSHRNRLWPLAAQALRKAAPGAEILEAPTLADLSRVAAHALAEKPAVLAIAGGDGTVTHVLTALCNAARALGGELPALSLLGGGAYDSLAALGGRGAAEDKLRRLNVALRSETKLVVEERDALAVDGQLGFRVGVGLPVRFVEEIYARGGLGPLTGARTLLRAFASSLVQGPFSRELYRPLACAVHVDGDEWPPIPLYGLVCSSVAEAGLGLRPFRRATEQPGFFQVLGLTAGPLAFALELPRLLLGHPARRDRLIDAVAESVELRGQRGLAYFLDGELRRAGESLRIALGPRVRLVRA